MQQAEYKTKDLGEAAALLCSSQKLLRMDKEKNFYWFIFSNRKSGEDLSNKYWFGELFVNAKSYRDAMETLKDRLFARG